MLNNFSMTIALTLLLCIDLMFCFQQKAPAFLRGLEVLID